MKKFFAAPSVPEAVGGVPVRFSPRARRLSLRVDSRSGTVVLVWPRRTSLRRAEDFVQQSRGWIDKQQALHPTPKHFAPDMSLSLSGRDYTLRHRAGRGLTHIAGDDIVVRGAAESFHRRVCDFLKAEALCVMTALADAKAAAAGMTPAPVRIADPRARWGSCATDGRLMFSWRLVLAPPVVADYLAAHETAHRRHMNHGARFWALCRQLSLDMDAAEKWLKVHGASLMAWRP